MVSGGGRDDEFAGRLGFGTELLRVVLNEGYAQQEASGQVNIWAELFNPFKSYKRHLLMVSHR